MYDRHTLHGWIHVLSEENNRDADPIIMNQCQTRLLVLYVIDNIF